MGEGPSSGEPLLEFLEVMRRLRAECAWKAGQTHRSLARYLLEETHETLEAIDSGDAEHLREELGVFTFYFDAAATTEKMRRRNPHVFGTEAGGTPEEINEVWEAIKAAEK